MYDGRCKCDNESIIPHATDDDTFNNFIDLIRDR